MISQDVGFQINELSRRLTIIEKLIVRLDKDPIAYESDWDNATLLREWGICERTAANYRQQGLKYFKRGGRIFYSPENRAKFIETKKLCINEKETDYGK